MSDISDVLNVLVANIGATLYPNGTAQTSVAGCPVRVFAGWPIAAQLDADLAAGTCNVSVFPTPTERKTTRYLLQPAQASHQAASLSASLTGQTIVFGGVQPAPFYAHNFVILVGSMAYGYQSTAADTPSTIAAAMAALIPGASASGPVLTIPPGGGTVQARIGTTGTLTTEVRRQNRLMQVTIWADTPAHRDAIAQPVDLALAQVEFLTMPDGTAARIIYRDSPVTDGLEKQVLYRRDLRYDVEYATTTSQTTADVLAITAVNFNYDTGAQVSSNSY